VPVFDRRVGSLSRQTATGQRTSLAPARQALPVNARLGPPCAAPQHRVATITGRRGFQPWRPCCVGRDQMRTPTFLQAGRPKLTPQKPTGKLSGHVTHGRAEGDYETETLRSTASSVAFSCGRFKPRCSGDPWLRSWPSFGCTNFNRLFSQRILALSIGILSRSILNGTQTVPLQHSHPIQG
jgi:hypothetical protein